MSLVTTAATTRYLQTQAPFKPFQPAHRATVLLPWCVY